MVEEGSQPEVEPTALSRRAARALFQAALKKRVYTGEVYYLVGPGGIGKSYELRLIDAQAKRRRDTLRGRVLESGIIDLGHTRYQQPLLLMATLARRITRSLTGQPNTPDHFTTFFREADRYLRAGGDGGVEAVSLEHIRTCFLADYRDATAKRRVVITIDTFERLDPRLPEVERYDFRSLTRLEAWLVDLLVDLPNSLIFIAGRKRDRQASEMQQRLGPRLAGYIGLPQLSANEVRDFLQREGIPEPERDLDWYKRMYTVSGGLPVRLIVAIEIGRACGFEPDHLPPSLSGDGPVTKKQLGHDFVEAFIGSLYGSNPQLGMLIELACYLRKGLRAELVQRIVGLELSAVQALLGQLREFGFVKVSGDELLTLHDEVYDLLEDRVGVSSADTWRFQAITFFVQAQNQLSAEIRQHGMSIERLGRLRTYQVDRLYYQFAREPTVIGYQNYCELVYSAIFARDEEFATQLQDELARFYDASSQHGAAYRRKLAQGDVSWERIGYDEAVRLAFRRIHFPDNTPHGGYRATLVLAERIAQDYHELLAADELAQCALATVRLEAEGFLAAGDDLDPVMQRYAALVSSLERIEQISTGDDSGDERPINYYRRQQSRFLRAYALNNWGYLARRRYRLYTAIERYTAAIEIYKTLGDETNVLRATSLNNLGFAYRLQGQLELALVCITEAITLQQQAGARYREAAGHTTRSILQLDMGNTLGAQHSAEQAKALLNDFPNTRNVALLAEREGLITRRLAEQARDDPQRSKQLYQEALGHYERFRSYFDQSGSDRVRSIDARQELGATYRSLEHARLQWGEDGRPEMERALELFREARALLGAGDRQSYVDLSEDIAFTYVLQGRYDEALAELGIVDELARSEPIVGAFVVRLAAGAIETEITREQRGFWLQLSKVELLRGICHINRGEDERACESLLRSFAFILRYSPESPQLRTYREVTINNLLRRYRASSEGAAALRTLRQKAYLAAQRFGVREAFFKLEQVFDAVEQILKLL